MSDSVIVTSAIAAGRRPSLPLKIISSIRFPRRVFGCCSPSTQRMASTTLLLPHPLGPTMPATPDPNSNWVRSMKDLNP